MSDYFNSISNDNTEIKTLEAVLKEINKKLDDSLKAIQEGVYTKSVGKVISDLESDNDKVENDILKSKSKTRKKLDFDKCYQFLFYKDKIKIIFYPTDDHTIRSLDDGSNGNNGEDNKNEGGSVILDQILLVHFEKLHLHHFYKLILI